MLSEIGPHVYSILKQMYDSSFEDRYETDLQRRPVDTVRLRGEFRQALLECVGFLAAGELSALGEMLNEVEEIAEKGHIATIGHSAKYGPWTTGPWSGRFHNVKKIRKMISIDRLPVLYPIPYEKSAYTWRTSYGEDDWAIMRIPYIYFTDYGVVYNIRAMPYTVKDKSCNIWPFDAPQSYEDIADGKLPYFMTSELYERVEDVR